MAKLLINDKSVSVHEFIDKVESVSGIRIPLEEIKSNQEFDYNKVKKKLNLGVFRQTGQKTYDVLRSDDVLANFSVFDEKTGQTVNFRYVSRLPYPNPKNPEALVYEPKAIDIPGGTFSYEKKELELSVYMYCYPLCFDSPFYNPEKVYKYSHNNIKANSKKKREKLSKKQMAFQHASVVGEHELKPLAKGLGLLIPDSYDNEDIRAELQEYALEHFEVYLKKTSTETIKYEGMIQDAIDRGIVFLEKVGSISVWKFKEGRKAGEHIMSVPQEEKDVNGALKTFLKANIATYYADFTTLNKDLTADMNAETYLKSLKNGAPESTYKGASRVLKVSEFSDFKSTKKVLTEMHPNNRQPGPQKTNELLGKIESGEITDDNINEEYVHYMNKDLE